MPRETRLGACQLALKPTWPYTEPERCTAAGRHLSLGKRASQSDLGLRAA